MDELEAAEQELADAAAEGRALLDAHDNVVAQWNAGDMTPDRRAQIANLRTRLKANADRYRAAQHVVDAIYAQHIDAAIDYEEHGEQHLLDWLRTAVEDLQDETHDIAVRVDSHAYEAIAERLNAPRRKGRR